MKAGDSHIYKVNKMQRKLRRNELKPLKSETPTWKQNTNLKTAVHSHEHYFDIYCLLIIISLKEWNTDVIAVQFSLNVLSNQENIIVITLI